MDPILLRPLKSEEILQRLIDRGVKDIRKLHVFSCLESTNDYLLNEEFDANEIVVCMAEQQTRGRGRYGHQWYSPPGVNLYMSKLWPLSGSQTQYELLSLWLLLAIADVLANYGISEIQLKWPNDICKENKKLAGILLEKKLLQARSYLVIGVGLNIAMSLESEIDFDTPWADIYSIKPDLHYSRNEIAADLLAKFHQTLQHFEKGLLKDLPDKWQNYDMLANRKVKFINNGKEQKGLAKGIDKSGNLILDLDGKIEYLSSAIVQNIKVI